MEEFVDLVNANGEAVLRHVPRSEVRRRKNELISQGLFQPIVIVVVFDDDDRVIAQVRGTSKGDDGALEIDHVCGVVAAGEAWEEAGRREAAEEVGVELADLELIEQRVNVYQRYRSLAVARALGDPKVVNPHEVSRVFRASPEELRTMQADAASFVRGFFDDLNMALVRRHRLESALGVSMVPHGGRSA
ncbi:ADP-ribose pyrophosphatase YjhB (NUDIX family) [Micromonospora profundi]|uniref:NUDIX hydrolase n=1 Tax=Micromonospora profundi TaxID=1420889 RepID=UPI00143ABF5F|nr:NUDIX hydrolase [Micromonospora profundi]NJC12945.1 ADP-ribose pyrophosphatase YjhB (NUDIX family) [Micromonospora profundi]